MRRDGGGWVPDGRAKTIRADCEASLAALDGLPIDLYLIHAPDPGTPWRTTLRALARLADDGLVRTVGVANVNLPQLDEALELAPVPAVQVALSPFDDRALRGGIVERCAERGVAVIAHSPLGGVRRAGSLARNEALAAVARARGATAAEVALAWLLALSPAVVAIPGARRPETAASAARAATLALDADEREALDRAFGRSRPSRVARGTTGVVLVMGIPGAGKSRVAADYVARGYVRLNRDERAGSLRALQTRSTTSCGRGRQPVVLDNTYVTRASRSYVVDAARRHGVSARCVWLDTPLAQAQVNLVERLLERFGSLPSPEELARAAQDEPGVLLPTSQMRLLRELEPPSADEGFASVERVPFVRAPSGRTRSGVFLAAAAVAAQDGMDSTRTRRTSSSTGARTATARRSPRDVARVAAVVSGPVEGALCPTPPGRHAAGAGRRSPGCFSRSRARTTSTRPARSLVGSQSGASHAGDDAWRALRRGLSREALGLGDDHDARRRRHDRADPVGARHAEGAERAPRGEVDPRAERRGVDEREPARVRRPDDAEQAGPAGCGLRRALEERARRRRDRGRARARGRVRHLPEHGGVPELVEEDPERRDEADEADGGEVLRIVRWGRMATVAPAMVGTNASSRKRVSPSSRSLATFRS